jgi:uncharacterized protein
MPAAGKRRGWLQQWRPSADNEGAGLRAGLRPAPWPLRAHRLHWRPPVLGRQRRTVPGKRDVNLREDKRLRAAAQGLLAFIGLVLLGAGLALLSGITQSGQPAASPALVMMQPLPDGHGPYGRPAARHGLRPGIAEPGTVPGVAPQADEPPRREGRPSNGRARLAIVIDDIGHSADSADRFLALGYPMTFSVLPDVAHAREAADHIRRAGREFIIHLPMQPFDFPRENPGPYPLLLSQGMEETARRVREYIADLPDAIGASNHMGSAYTYDAERMEVVQTVLAEHHLFFLNSKTSATPVPERIAHQWGYTYLERDVFLDHDPSEAAVEDAFRQAVRRAGHNGHAIAIGHPLPQTLRVLRRQLPRLSAQGVQAVSLSTLLGR